MDCHVFLPAKQWFSNALPKAMKTCFKAMLLIITHTVGGICDNSWRKLTAPNLTATCNLLSPQKSMRWFSGSNVMIVGPILLTSQKLKSSSWKNGVWPIEYFPISVSVLLSTTIGIIKLINAYYIYWSYNNWYWCDFTSSVANLK